MLIYSVLKAEAYLWGDEQNLSAAADIIDKIRQRAGLQVLSSSVRNNESALKTAYLNERRNGIGIRRTTLRLTFVV